ncbi:MAG: hypothetical protein ABI467_28035 [Kofleriaceae bacterium]
MRACAGFAVALIACTSADSTPLASGSAASPARARVVERVASERDALATVEVLERPILATLVIRIAALKRALRGNLPGWEDMLRVTDLANDELGLPPFSQVTAPGTGWRPSPATLLGIGPYVERRGEALAQAGQPDELSRLVIDARRRYAEGASRVAEELARVEHWLEHR